ncbi:hypothetical protein FQN53_009050 [Emmonsiellopsis sp. PD_33]|nr:hypothetical protein FQN53_009050 [Emmonsiellopsis sp. PD_33]KAK2797651.1 hypothetical protein FQN51_008345 [Onygenales sp. PD_10]
MDPKSPTSSILSRFLPSRRDKTMDEERAPNEGSLPELAPTRPICDPPNPLDVNKLSFFDLPIEVRRKIYHYAMVPGRVFSRAFMFIDTTQGAYCTDSGTQGGPVNYPLLRTARRVYEEIVPIYYSENIFSFVHPDAFVGVLNRSPRLRSNICYIHKVELIFDFRDIQHLTDGFCKELDHTISVIQASGAPGSSRMRDQTVTHLKSLYDDIKGNNLPAVPANQQLNVDLHAFNHKLHIRNLRKYLWGPTLSFFRQRLLVTHLYLDFTNCYCYDLCCRLVEKVMYWGAIPVWVFGVPVNICITGAAPEETMAVLTAINSQRATRKNTKALLEGVGLGVEEGELASHRMTGVALRMIAENNPLRGEPKPEMEKEKETEKETEPKPET